jgi:hypothetical protein
MPSMHAVYMKENVSSVRYAYLSDVASEHSLLEGDMARLGGARLISEQFLNCLRSSLTALLHLG